MPRLPIDYSKTIIYKICCKDVNITDIYVGHSTDLIRRRRQHKQNCNNETEKEYNVYKYQFIRENGGWDNWSVIPIEEYSCENVNQARIRERYWIETLQSSLNKVISSRTHKEWRDDNKEHLKEKHKEYYEENKNIIIKKVKEYRENNLDIIKEKFNCECGGKYTHQHKSEHLNTKKHQDYLTQTIPANNLT